MDNWGGDCIVANGEKFFPQSMMGFVAEIGKHHSGVLTYDMRGGAVHIVFLQAFYKYCGVGTVLLNAAVEEARKNKCRRIYLETTNDNMEALRFYQRRGFRIHAIHPDSVTSARQMLKPGIPKLGAYDIPMMDELELEMLLE